MLPNNSTWTLTRDTALGLHFRVVTYYDGRGFMVPRKLGVKSAKELDGATSARVDIAALPRAQQWPGQSAPLPAAIGEPTLASAVAGRHTGSGRHLR
jgi:hypothetical protein